MVYEIVMRARVRAAAELFYAVRGLIMRAGSSLGIFPVPRKNAMVILPRLTSTAHSVGGEKTFILLSRFMPKVFGEKLYSAAAAVVAKERGKG